MGRHRARWRASEEIAFRVLEEKGFRIVEKHRKVVIDGVEVSDVDAVAVGPDGSLYAVEVKAGRIDVTAIRQAVVNAQLLGMKPLVVGKGFADEAAEVTAKRLGVETVILEDVFLVDPEELETIVETALARILLDTIRLLFSPEARVPPGELEFYRVIAQSPTPVDAAKRLGVSVRDVMERVDKLKKLSKLARHGWEGARVTALLLLQRSYLEARLNSLACRGEEPVM